MAMPLHCHCTSVLDAKGRAHRESGNRAEQHTPMTLKIERAVRQESTVFVLSGRFEAEHIEELEGLFQLQNGTPAIVLDLREIRLADRGAVKFLARCEAGGVRLENCPGYIREWMGKEKP